MYQRGKSMQQKSHFPLGAQRNEQAIASPFWWRPCCRMRPWKVMSLLLVCAAVVMLFHMPEMQRRAAPWRPTRCEWKEGDATLYHLKTKLAVNYEGSHWFHMAENFLTQHSLLAQSRRQSNASRIYYSLDNGAFVAQLSAMTRMMVALGTVSPEGAAAASSTLHYAHLDESVLPWFDRPPITGSAGAAGGHAPALAPGQAFLLLPSMVAVQTVVSLGGNVALENRFKETKPKAGEAGAAGLSGATAFIVGTGDASGAALNMTEGGTCIKYIDTIGGLWPTPQRGHWFPDDGDIVNFRSKIRQWCFAGKASSPPSGNGAGRKYKLVIYQRDLSRKLANELRALEMLGAALPASQWEIRVLMHTKDRSPCSLAHALRDTDVLLTPHGFQSMLLLFLPRPALLFEVFPYRYYKRGYGPLSREYGVLHAGVMSPPLTWHTRLVLSLISTTYCMIGKQCRNYARSDNVWLTQHGVNVLVAAIYGKLLPALAAAGPRRDKLIE